MKSFYLKYEYFIVLLFVLIWQTTLIFVSDGFFIEIDSYTHALRLMDFIQSGSWQEILYRHDNCPFGQMLHFSRITDMFLYLTTLPFLPFMELKQAILFGGFLYNPLIACLTAVALIWSGRSFFSPMLRGTGTFFYFVQGFVLSLFQAGRPDHHVLLNLLLIVLLGCLMYGAKTQKTAYYKTAGIFGGLAVWATPEGFLSGLFIFAGLVTAWLFRYQNMRQIRLFSQYLFISTVVCLLVNPPMQGLFYPDNSRLSFLMVVVLGFAFLSFYAEEFMERKKHVHSFFGRLFSLSFWALLFFCFTLFLFGKKALFSSPIPPELYEIWTSHIIELKSGFSKDFPRSPAFFLFYIFLISIISYFFANRQIRKLLIINGLPLFAFLGLMVISRRFGRSAASFSTYALMFSLYTVYQNLIDISSKTFVKIKIALLFALFLSYAGTVYVCCKNQKNLEKRIVAPREYLSYISPKGCIMTRSDQGPETAWATGQGVIGSPYHSNVQGIIDSHTFLNSTNQHQFQSLLKERNIQTILIRKKIKKDQTASEEHAIFNQIASGKLEVCFLHPAPDLSEKIKTKYFIFHVDFTACEKAGTKAP